MGDGTLRYGHSIEVGGIRGAHALFDILHKGSKDPLSKFAAPVIDTHYPSAP